MHLNPCFSACHPSCSSYVVYLLQLSSSLHLDVHCPVVPWSLRAIFLPISSDLVPLIFQLGCAKSCFRDAPTSPHNSSPRISWLSYTTFFNLHGPLSLNMPPWLHQSLSIITCPRQVTSSPSSMSVIAIPCTIKHISNYKFNLNLLPSIKT